MHLLIRLLRSVLPVAMLSILAACAAPQATPTPEPTATTAPTATSAAPLALLIVPPQADIALAGAAAEVVTQYATEHQLRFEQREMLDPSQAPAETVNLVMLAPDPGVAALAAALPFAQIVTIGFDPDGDFANVTSILAGGASEGATAFIAGYTAALVADDWRAGMIYTAASQTLADDFIAGAEYYCGACVPLAPPESEFPMAAQATDASNWQSAADLLLSNFTRVVYLAPEMEASGAGPYLAGFGVYLIGTGTPSADVQGSWLASVSSDPVAALRQQLPLALDGQATPAGSSLGLSNINTEFVSDAKLANIQAIINDLLAGYITLPQ